MKDEDDLFEMQKKQKLEDDINQSRKCLTKEFRRSKSVG
jgi:hypothetical protein